MSKEDKRQRQQDRAAQRQRRNRLVAAAVVALVLVAGAGWLVKVKLAARTAGPARLVGRWIRADGGYVLDLRRAEADGRLEAAYYNPRPIHVAQATCRHSNGQWQVFVELRDQNYPGATYRLAYQPDEDRLAGLYHQPLVGETFDVVFARAPSPGPAP